ncbi:MAG: hypothetical protein H6883_14915 [Rhodobiaceae bacterium]|nr:hypothetical protein [Rhodobiaceae bacterium]MCC0057411.1 hypothetical protein [Rhodobiaceae bacterium]
MNTVSVRDREDQSTILDLDIADLLGFERMQGVENGDAVASAGRLFCKIGIGEPEA